MEDSLESALKIRLRLVEDDLESLQMRAHAREVLDAISALRQEAADIEKALARVAMRQVE
jgi:hypothetical protein